MKNKAVVKTKGSQKDTIFSLLSRKINTLGQGLYYFAFFLAESQGN